MAVAMVVVVVVVVYPLPAEDRNVFCTYDTITA
jgi:hypothetical protein